MGHAYHGQQGQLLPLIATFHRRFALAMLLMLPSANAWPQSVRDHPRLAPAGGTTVSKTQAAELTLTVTDVAIRPIQIWVRTAGTIGGDQRTIVANVSQAEGKLLKV